jgi:predicted TPR repeat methyltransferase
MMATPPPDDRPETRVVPSSSLDQDRTGHLKWLASPHRKEHASTSLDHRRAAIALHREGRLDEAEGAYRLLLESHPEDADVLQLLGVIAAQTGRLEEAEGFLDQALKYDPSHAEAHNNLGNLRQLQGRLGDAVTCHRRAVELRPESVRAHFNLGVALGSAGSLDEAAESYLRCLELTPAMAAAHHNLGMIRKRQGRLDEAAESLTRATRLSPDDAGAHENLGVVRRSQRRLSDAADAFQRALDLDPSRRRLEHLIAAYRGQTPDAAPDYYVEDLFDSMAGDFDDHLVRILGYRTPAALKAMLLELLGDDHRFRRVLDVGCGTGLAGVEFAPFSAELWGVDLSRKMLDHASARGIYHRLEASSIEAFLQADDAVFDLVVAADVFVYVGNLKRAFELIRRRSAEGAIFLFSTEITEEADFVLNPTGRYGHAKSYIEELARATGFAVIRFARQPLRTENEEMVMGHCFLLQAA